ncbi:hypothetical protein [Corynebacterium sp. AOP12-C2-36]|uniref:hypothetical protein n=1 Tax=Corynebacterium sp. AOP12-C2-36 TaxID=3457723 RepID=UPI004033AB35
MVSSLAVLGPDPAALGVVLERLGDRDIELVIAGLRVKVRPSQGGGVVGLLQAAVALGAAAVERAAEAARPTLPPRPEGRGRPRALDDADVQKIADAPAAVSAAALAADLGVSARTVQRYRAELREAP